MYIVHFSPGIEQQKQVYKVYNCKAINVVVVYNERTLVNKLMTW